MFCVYCRTENDPEQRFCPNCGRPLQSMPELVQEVYNAAQARASLSPAHQQHAAVGATNLLFKQFQRGLALVATLMLIIVLFVVGWLWSRPLEGQAPLITLSGHTQETVAAVWSPDGKRIASGGNDNTVRVWDASSGRQLFLYRGYHPYINGLVWSPEGKRIASISQDRSIHIWDATNGGNERIIRLPQEPTSLSWSPDGTRLAISSTSDNTVLIVEVSSGDVLSRFKEHTSSVYQIAWSPDGKRIASASHDKTVRVWDPEGNSPALVYRGHQDMVLYLAWSPDGKRIVSVSEDHGPYDNATIQTWEVASLRLLYTYQPGRGYHVTGIAWSPDGKRIAISANYDLIHVWNATTGHPIFSYRGLSRSHTFTAPNWSPDSTKLVVASSDNNISIIQPRDTFIGQAYLFDLVDIGMIGSGFLLLLFAIRIVGGGKKVNPWRVARLALVIALITGACMGVMIISGWNPLIPWSRTV